MFIAKLSIEVWCPDSVLGGFEFINKLSLPIPPYIGMEIYHSGYEMFIDYIAIEYDNTNHSSIICSLKEIEEAIFLLHKRCLITDGNLIPPGIQKMN